MKRTLLFITLIVISYNGFSQDCDCYSNLKWLIETFEKNDAGFQYIVDKKGEDYYSYFTKEKLKEAENIAALFECKDLLNEWLLFFRKGHIGITLNNQKKGGKVENLYETLKINHREFRKYLENKEITRFEGIWDISPYFSIGIIRDKFSKVKEGEYVRKYIGFIINSNTRLWETNQIKLEIFKSQTDASYMMKYYTGDHSLQRFNNIEFLGDDFIKSGFIFLEKTFPKQTNPISELEIKSIKNPFPFTSEISNNTMYLRIPTFNIQHKKLIDSIIVSNFDRFTSHKNLIIDIRNNGGGSDLSYQNILPLLYTNPIRIVQQEYLSTELNLRPLLNIVNDSTSDKETKEFCKKLSEKMRNNPNEFVSFTDGIVDEKRFDTIYKYPHKVAILINKNCRSSAEQFVYEARQSYKVKLFGTSTYGAIDISNMSYSVFSTDNRLTLWYSTSKSYRIPDLIADDIGFPPDYYYDRTIMPYDWIEHTNRILNE